MEVILGMLFFILSAAHIWFVEMKLVWRIYTTAKALPITQRVELMDQNDFTKAALSKTFETFVILVAALETLEPTRMSIHTF